MTEFYFVRHGQIDSSLSDYGIYRGRGYNMLPLSKTGIEQIRETAKRLEPKSCELNVSSPFGRALNSAAILSKELSLDIRIESGLHEWQPDKEDFEFLPYEEAQRRFDQLRRYGGDYPPDTDGGYETAEMMKRRVFAVLDKYTDHKRVIVVCHGTLMQYVLGIPHPENGEVSEFVYG